MKVNYLLYPPVSHWLKRLLSPHKIKIYAGPKGICSVQTMPIPFITVICLKVWRPEWRAHFAEESRAPFVGCQATSTLKLTIGGCACVCSCVRLVIASVLTEATLSVWEFRSVLAGNTGSVLPRQASSVRLKYFKTDSILNSFLLPTTSQHRHSGFREMLTQWDKI